MATLTKRESRVLPMWELPKGMRDRRWGLRHDQIWFYATLDTNYYDGLDVAYEDPHGMVCVDTSRPWRFWRQLEDDRWLRLYMDRWILKTAWRLFRLHTFYTGDEETPHDHPFDFWTFPLRQYTETVERRLSPWELAAARSFAALRGGTIADDWTREVRTVPAFRWSYRPAEYRHVVHEPRRPFKTLVIARSTRPRKWGFWPEPHTFVPYDEWVKYD